MKTKILRLGITVLIAIGVISCGSKSEKKTESVMSVKEAIMWTAAFTSERINVGDIIRIEAGDSLLAHINTSRSLDNVFTFKPSIKGTAQYSHGGRYIDFIPASGALIQGEQYNCRVSLSTLTGIKTLKDFSFDFAVERKEVKLTDVKVSVDPENLDQIIVSGQMMFSTEPGVKSTESSSLKCNVSGTKSTISATSDKLCHTFTIKGIKRNEQDTEMTIEYDPKDDFSVASETIFVPGLYNFKMLNATLYNTGEPYINIEFTAPLNNEQELDGLITIDDIDNVRLERGVTNVKVFFPVNSLTRLVLRVSELIKSDEGNTLRSDIEQHFEQKILDPEVRIPISGTILPDGNNLTLPFQAVNLAAVDVEVVKIYTDNIMTFLQENELDDKGMLRRVGRLIYRQTVRLDEDKDINLHQWQNFSIDLKDLFHQERGALYNIRLSFRKAYSLYGRNEVGEIEIQSGVTSYDNEKWDENYSYISRYAPDYDGGKYEWDETDDPSKDSYYMVSSRMPEYNLIASDIGLIVKRAEGNQLWCSVSNLMTTTPMLGVLVTAYNYQMREIGSAYTDRQGFADFKVNGNPFIVTASNGISTTYLKVGGGYELSTSRFDIGGKKTINGIKGFVYGERGVWRPGDKIYLTLVVEDKNNTLPKNHPVTMEFYTPRGQLYDKQILTQSVDGIYAFTTATTDNALTGKWKARFLVGGQEFSHDVNIETIKPNRIKIKMSLPEILQSGEDNDIAIEANWLSGPAAAGLKANVSMSLYSISTPFKQYKNYSFNNPLNTFQKSEYKIYDDFLDSEGKASYKYKAPLAQQAPGMLAANIITRVKEKGGDESIVSNQILFSPYKSYVGVALGDKEFETDSDLSFPIVTLDPSGNPIDRGLKYKIYKLRWSWWWDDFDYRHDNTGVIVASGNVTTKEGVAEIPFRVDYPTWGRYLVYVEDTISGHTSGGLIYVDWPDWRGRSEKNDPTAATMYSFSLDKDNYSVGEFATVYLPKSTGGRLLLSVENGSKVISRQWVNLTDDRDTVSRILITDEMTPNFYVHAMLLQPHAQTVNDLPMRMYGIEHASVIDVEKELHPVIDVPETILPQHEFTVKVSEKDGKPMSYTLAIVDEGLLDITAYKTPKIWYVMNQRYALGVKTWDMYADVIGAYGGKFKSILSIGGDYEIDEEDESRSSSGKEKRFNPVVKFLGPFTLDEGENTHEITLPMYVGSVRVMVVAAKDGAYGSADKNMAVRSPLMILATMPRQLSCGDYVKLPVNIFATEEGLGTVDVTVNIEGPAYVKDTSFKQLIFNQPSDQLVCFDLVCDTIRSGKAKVTITANGEKQQATEIIYIDVRNPLPDIITSKNKLLAEGDSCQFEISQNDTETQLAVSTMPSIDFNGAFSFVEHYPHYCTEQLSSRAMYMLYARKFLPKDDIYKAEEALPLLIKEILSRQLHSGGFEYWPGDREANDWATSMAGEVLVEARRQGFVVPDQALVRWKKHQHTVSRAYRHKTEYAYDMTQAYRLYTLALSGEQPIAAMNKLRESKNISKQALLRLAAAYTLTGRNDIAVKLLDRVETTPYIKGDYSTFWSSLRDKAMAVETYLLTGEDEMAFALVNEVADEFSADYCSTQDVAFVSVAMNRISGVAEGNLGEITIMQGSRVRKVRDIKDVMCFTLDPNEGNVVVKNSGNKSVHLVLTRRSTPSVTQGIKANSKGVDVSVKYTDLDGNEIRTLYFKQGKEFLVHVKVKNYGERSNSMALTYYVPSGCEIWNERLFGNEKDSGASYVDIKDDHISWYFSIGSDEEDVFTVKLRASYAGTFILPSTVCEDMYNTNCRAMTGTRKLWVK